MPGDPTVFQGKRGLRSVCADTTIVKDFFPIVQTSGSVCALNAPGAKQFCSRQRNSSRFTTAGTAATIAGSGS
jgi:hypothetical protein